MYKNIGFFGTCIFVCGVTSNLSAASPADALIHLQTSLELLGKKIGGSSESETKGIAGLLAMLDLAKFNRTLIAADVHEVHSGGMRTIMIAIGLRDQSDNESVLIFKYNPMIHTLQLEADSSTITLDYALRLPWRQAGAIPPWENDVVMESQIAWSPSGHRIVLIASDKNKKASVMLWGFESNRSDKLFPVDSSSTYSEPLSACEAVWLDDNLLLVNAIFPKIVSWNNDSKKATLQIDTISLYKEKIETWTLKGKTEISENRVIGQHQISAYPRTIHHIVRERDICCCSVQNPVQIVDTLKPRQTYNVQEIQLTENLHDEGDYYLHLYRHNWGSGVGNICFLISSKPSKVYTGVYTGSGSIMFVSQNNQRTLYSSGGMISKGVSITTSNDIKSASLSYCAANKSWLVFVGDNVGGKVFEYDTKTNKWLEKVTLADAQSVSFTPNGAYALIVTKDSLQLVESKSCFKLSK